MSMKVVLTLDIAGSTDIGELEDVVAAALYAAGWRGTLDCDVTGSTVNFDPPHGQIREWMFNRISNLQVMVGFVLDEVIKRKVKILLDDDSEGDVELTYAEYRRREEGE